jgi:hypothetical protein
MISEPRMEWRIWTSLLLNAFMTREGYEAKRSGFLVTFEVPSS